MFSRVLPFFAGAFALLASGVLLAQQPKPEIGRNETACCKTSSGQNACGDIIPLQCRGLEIKVYNRQGLHVRTIPPPMTQAERAAAEKKRREELAARAQAREQARQDHALLQTYTSLADIDQRQKSAEGAVNAELNNILAKIGASKQKIGELRQEASLHSAQNIPMALAQSIRDEEFEMQAQNDLLAAKRRELDLIRERYTNDRLRYIALTEQNKR
ncbi:MAG: hypothetical protein FWH15_03320 [Betaproteobacteria bacterium]|nr:hypothetical protein [Betaproteobacteria bacterium]